MSIVISLRQDGLFEAAACGRSIRIGYSDGDVATPWVVMEIDDSGVAWEILNSFNTLDQALDKAAATALDVDVAREFTVRMPDGMTFKRPGRKSAEEVLASAGWYYVTDLIGFALYHTDEKSNPIEIRNSVKNLIKNKDIRVQDVSFADSEDGSDLWIVDLAISYGGWLRNDQIQDEVRASLHGESIEISECYDFRKRVSLAANTATIIPFPCERIVRAA